MGSAPYVIAMAAGVLSFLSPCCLPMMPGYLAVVGGARQDGVLVSRRAVMTAAVAFVLGFTLVFTLLGASASVVGAALLRNRLTLTRAAGIVLILLGLANLGILRIRWLSSETRPFLNRMGGSPSAALPLGMAFAIGWSPCIGPVLTGILTAAASTSSLVAGASLLVAYSLGLALPFLALAAGAGTPAVMATLRRHARGIEMGGGLLLIAIGVLMLSGAWQWLFAPLQRAISGTGWPPL